LTESSGPSKYGFRHRISAYFRTMSFSGKMPHLKEVWRRNRNGAREKNVQRSKASANPIPAFFVLGQRKRISNVLTVDDHPLGYPQLAAFINSDPNFLMCRRFGFLHTRVLLYRQDELAQLENDLVSLDAEDEQIAPKALISRKLDEARQDSPRKALIQGIDEKLKEYGKTSLTGHVLRLALKHATDELVVRCQAFASLKKASTRNYNSFANWIHNKKPLSREESKFVKHDEDFIALADGQEGGWFDGFVEDILSLVPCKLSRVSLPPLSLLQTTTPFPSAQGANHDRLTRTAPLHLPDPTPQNRRRLRAPVLQRTDRHPRPARHHSTGRLAADGARRGAVQRAGTGQHQDRRHFAVHLLLLRGVVGIYQGQEARGLCGYCGVSVLDLFFFFTPCVIRAPVSFLPVFSNGVGLYPGRYECFRFPPQWRQL